MSNVNSQGEVQRLLGEKEQLKREEQQLRQIIDQVKKQINSLQVEQLEVSNRVPLSRVSPVDLGLEKKEELNHELSLDVLNQMVRGTYVVEQEEEDED